MMDGVHAVLCVLNIHQCNSQIETGGWIEWEEPGLTCKTGVVGLCVLF